MVYYQVRTFEGYLRKRSSADILWSQAGIGTYTIPEIATPLFAKISKVRISFGPELIPFN